MLTLTSPVKTGAHSVPAGPKLAALGLVTVILFAMTTPLALTMALAILSLVVASCGSIFSMALIRSLRPLWPFLVVLALWHLWLGDLAGGAATALRMITAVAAASFVTMTTPLAEMLALFQRLLSPLARAGLNPKALALALALMIRFIPVMLDRFEILSHAWRARSPRRIGWHVVMPATLAALDDATHVAEALRARGGAL